MLPEIAPHQIPTTFRAAPELAKDGFLYVWGKVEYSDGFDKPRHTRFCHRYPCRMHDPNGFPRIEKKYARYHQHGNDAT
jgi:hypothetical protein